MSDVIRFFVPGMPAPKGSMKAFVVGGHARVTHDNKRTKPWSAAVSHAAMLAMRGRQRFEGTAIEIRAIFGLKRPASHHGKRGVLPGAPDWPATKPDLDKLTRCVADAMQGIVFDDDSRVVEWWIGKVYAEVGYPTGVGIEVQAASVNHCAEQAESYEQMTVYEYEETSGTKKKAD